MDLETQYVNHAVPKDAAYIAKPHDIGKVQCHAGMKSRILRDPGWRGAGQHRIM